MSEIRKPPRELTADEVDAVSGSSMNYFVVLARILGALESGEMVVLSEAAGGAAKGAK